MLGRIFRNSQAIEARGPTFGIRAAVFGQRILAGYARLPQAPDYSDTSAVVERSLRDDLGILMGASRQGGQA